MQPNPLSHVPTAFVQDVLIKLGALLFISPTRKGCFCTSSRLTKDPLRTLVPRILAGADCLTVEEPQTDEAPFPPSLRCSLSPPPHLPQGYAIPPTHLLMLTFADGDERSRTGGADPPLRLMVPIHEAVWTLRCHTVARLVSSASGSGAPSSPSSPSSSPNEPADTFDLPVISLPGPLPLAAFSTFSVLHTYLHTATLPSHLPSPDAGPDDDSFDSDSDSDSDSEFEFEDDDEDIDFASDFASSSDDDDGGDGGDGGDEEEDPRRILPQRRDQYEGLHSMCRTFGIPGSDPIYEWMAAAERRRGAAASERAQALFATRKREVALDASVDEEDTSSSSWSHLPTPAPG